MQLTTEITGNIVDVVKGEIFSGAVFFENSKIVHVTRSGFPQPDAAVIMPGVVNAHVHIESTKMSPMAAGIALSEVGVLGTISDPHEIANVCGVDGLNWMLSEGSKSPIQITYGVPSCVPATYAALETAGAELSAETVCTLLQTGDFKYLAEVMNWPGVIGNNPGLLQMIAEAKRLNLPIDGHAPEVVGAQLKAYLSAGIQTDHESSTYEEGLEKILAGMKILIREGSAAKNFDALIELIRHHPSAVMFCTDDSEPHEMKDTQPLALVRRGLERGYDPIALFRAATLNPIRHYGLDLGLLQSGDAADLIVLDSISQLNVVKAYRNGTQIVENGKSTVEFVAPTIINHFSASQISTEDLKISAASGNHKVRVIDVVPGQLITKGSEAVLSSVNGHLQSDPEKDILKLVVLNRYEPNQKPVVVFARNFGIKNGAIAGSVAHDSHNIIAVGSDDQSIAEAINLLVQHKGGVSLVGPEGASVVPLPVAGLMSDKHPDTVANLFADIERRSKGLGTTLPSAYMALSFMALLVIPELKVSDKVGLVDGKTLQPVSLFA